VLAVYIFEIVHSTKLCSYEFTISLPSVYRYKHRKSSQNNLMLFCITPKLFWSGWIKQLSLIAPFLTYSMILSVPNLIGHTTSHISGWCVWFIPTANRPVHPAHVKMCCHVQWAGNMDTRFSWDVNLTLTLKHNALVMWRTNRDFAHRCSVGTLGPPGNDGVSILGWKCCFVLRFLVGKVALSCIVILSLGFCFAYA